MVPLCIAVELFSYPNSSQFIVPWTVLLCCSFISSYFPMAVDQVQKVSSWKTSSSSLINSVCPELFWTSVDMKEMGNQKTANECKWGACGTDAICSAEAHRPWHGKGRRGPLRGEEWEHTVAGVARGQRGSLVYGEEDWGKEEDNPRGGCYANTERDEQAQPARDGKAASPQCGQQMLASGEWRQLLAGETHRNDSVLSSSLLKEGNQLLEPTEVQKKSVCWDSCICFQEWLSEGIWPRLFPASEPTRAESDILHPVEFSANISLNLIIDGSVSVFLGFAGCRGWVMGYGGFSPQTSGRWRRQVEANNLCYLSDCFPGLALS